MGMRGTRVGEAEVVEPMVEPNACNRHASSAMSVKSDNPIRPGS